MEDLCRRLLPQQRHNGTGHRTLHSARIVQDNLAQAAAGIAWSGRRDLVAFATSLIVSTAWEAKAGIVAQDKWLARIS